MKNVYFLIGTLSNGGAERVVSNLSLYLSEEIDKNIILFGDNSKIVYEYDGSIIYLDKSKTRSLLEKIKVFISRIRQIKDIKSEHIDNCIISFLEYPNLINLMYTKHSNVIISVRNHMSSKHSKGTKKLFWNLTIKLLYRKAKKIIAVSEEIKNDLIQNYGIDREKIKVIYNSYPIDRIKLLSQEDIEDEYKHIFDHPVIITSGRLNKQKGHWHLIRSFKLVKKYVPNAKLVILGEGELYDYLKCLSKELYLEEDIHFMGFVENPFKYIKKSKAFIFPSLYEGFPNALVEAMVCQVPVIASDCLSGPREILAPLEFNEENIIYDCRKDRHGILIPKCDGKMYTSKDKLTTEEIHMAKTMNNLLKDNELREYFCNQSIQRSSEFDINILIKQWEELI